MAKFLPSKQAMGVRFSLPARQFKSLLQSALSSQILEQNEFSAINQRLRHFASLRPQMPRPKFQVHKDGPKRYRVEVPKSLSVERKRKRAFLFDGGESRGLPAGL